MISEFLVKPIPLWDGRLTAELIENKLNDFKLKGILQTSNGYNTVNSYFKDNVEYPIVKYQLNIPTKSPVFLEQPSLGYLHSFYYTHGLEPLPIGILSSEKAMDKLNAAFKVMEQVPGCFDCVTGLVKCIQLLKNEDSEIDVSYSHPEIPFSIFISLCDEDCLTSDLRVCESILHEAMHLKLTLIEEIVPIVEANSEETFYSPWRGEDRPVKGVLHGLFVFRAILDFYKVLKEKTGSLFSDEAAASIRILEIKREIEMLSELHHCKSLTHTGRKLAIKLVQLPNPL